MWFFLNGRQCILDKPIDFILKYVKNMGLEFYFLFLVGFDIKLKISCGSVKRIHPNRYGHGVTNVEFNLIE